MNDKELYQQKVQAQLDGWKAEVDGLMAKASSVSADVRLGLNKQLRYVEGKIEEGKTKLAEIAVAGEERWDSLKEGAESAWTSLKSATNDAIAKMKG